MEHLATLLQTRFEQEGLDLDLSVEDDSIQLNHGGSTLHISKDAVRRPRLVIHDMILPGDGTEVDQSLNRWFDSLQGGSAPLIEEGLRYWVSADEVVSAVYRLMVGGGVLPDVMHICGRRGLTHAETLAEFSVLMRRTLRIKADGVQIEDLVPMDSSMESSSRNTRPDLAPLHGALISAGMPDGWRPMYGVGVALMQWLAWRLEEHEGVL